MIHDGDYTLLGLYGLAFFTLGVALAARAMAFERSPLRDRLLAFAAFAGVHGVFEWLYRAAIYSAAPVTTDGLLAFAATAYAPLLLLVLLERGLRPLYAGAATFLTTLGAITMLVLADPRTGEVILRLAWFAPMLAATAWAFLKGPSFEGLRQVDRGAAQRIAWALGAYGVTQFLVEPASFFPATIINTENFREVFGIPPLLLRATIATAIMLAVLSALNRFGLAHTEALKARARDNQMRLRAVLDAEPECVKVLDADGIILDMNPAGLEMCGIKRAQDVQGVSVYTLIKPQFHDAYRAALAASFRGAQSTVSYEIVSADGVHRVLEQRAAPLADAGDSRVDQVVAITRDVTERTYAEEALRRSTRMLERAQRIASTGCWEWDFITRKIVCSDQVSTILGLQTAPSTIQDIFAYIPEGDRDLLHEGVATAIRTGVGFDLRHRVLQPNGAVRVVRAQGEVEHDAAGVPVRVHGVLQDITGAHSVEESLRESEERLGRFVRMANDAIVIADAGDAIMMFSAGAERMFGYAAHEIIGRRLACLTPPDAARLDAQAAQRAAGEAADMTLLRKNGQPFTARVSLSRQSTPRGAVTTAVLHEIANDGLA